MKKFLTALIATAVVLGIPSAVYAEEQETDENTTVRLYANVESSYTVRLPEEVDVEDLSTDFTVEALGDISSAEKISVAFDSSATLTDQNPSDDKRDGIALTVTNGTFDFTYDVLSDEYTDAAAQTVTVSHEETIPAGIWEVSLPVSISLVEA